MHGQKDCERIIKALSDKMKVKRWYVISHGYSLVGEVRDFKKQVHQFWGWTEEESIEMVWTCAMEAINNDAIVVSLIEEMDLSSAELKKKNLVADTKHFVERYS